MRVRLQCLAHPLNNKEGSERRMLERTDSALLVSLFCVCELVLLHAVGQCLLGVVEAIADATIFWYLSYPRTEWLHILSQPLGCLKY